MLTREEDVDGEGKGPLTFKDEQRGQGTGEESLKGLRRNHQRQDSCSFREESK